MPQNCRIKDNILSNCGVESCVKIIIENFYFNHEHKNEVCLNNILNHDQSSTLSSYNLDRMITGYNIALMYSIQQHHLQQSAISNWLIQKSFQANSLFVHALAIQAHALGGLNVENNFFHATWNYFIGNPHHINIIMDFG